MVVGKSSEESESMAREKAESSVARGLRGVSGIVVPQGRCISKDPSLKHWCHLHPTPKFGAGLGQTMCLPLLLAMAQCQKI